MGQHGSWAIRICDWHPRRRRISLDGLITCRSCQLLTRWDDKLLAIQAAWKDFVAMPRRFSTFHILCIVRLWKSDWEHSPKGISSLQVAIQY